MTDVDFGIPIWKEVKDKPARAPNVIFVVVSHYQLPSSYIFALTSASFLDLPLLQEMIGGPKNCFQQRLIFYFRLQFAINFFLRSCTAG